MAQLVMGEADQVILEGRFLGYASKLMIIT